jgi:3-deoxy-D-manno-octulosonic-acid transferase
MVFVGGSLVRHGGQNPLEPAACGKAVLFGPHMFNFRPIVEILLKSDAAVSVADGRDLGGKVRMLLEDRNRMRDLGWNAKRALAANRGATMRNIEAIRRLLS